LISVPTGPGRLAILLALVLGAGCGPRRIELPTDPGQPLAGFEAIHEGVSAACRGVRTLRIVLALSGRAGDQSLRGSLHTGFARPASVRMELRAGPFGTPHFVLAAADAGAVLWLPRDDRVVRGASTEAIVEALTGLALGAADLQAVLTGCVVPAPRAVAARQHANGWVSMTLDGGATLYLRRSGDAWRLRAATRDDLRVEYPNWPDHSQFPARVRLLSSSPSVDLRASLSDLSANIDFDPGIFTLAAIPADARPMTIEELRASGPLTAP
jgi:hypothetical protein